MPKIQKYYSKVLIVASIFLLPIVGNAQNTVSPSRKVQKKVMEIEFNPIHTLSTSSEFVKIIGDISLDSNSLYVFDIDNTLLITNDNKFGSDWWYSQTDENKDLRLNVNSQCLFDILTPLFYATFSTTPVFPLQAEVLGLLEKESNKTIALTSRGYSPVVASATELELTKNEFGFLDADSLALENGVVMLNNVIYTRGKDKGVALLEYLETNPYANIYYFDDSFYKVEDVKEAFTKIGRKVDLYHLTIAPKIPYTEEEIEYMKEKLCIVISSINEINAEEPTACKCLNP